MPSQYALDISAFPLFTGLGHDLLNVVMEVGQLIELSEGERLLAAGQENHYLYVLLSGQLAVFLSEESTAPAALISVGDIIGEMSIIDGGRPSAYVHSVGTSELISIHEADFWDRLALLPGLMRNMTKVLTQRFRRANRAAIEAQAQQIHLDYLQKDLAAAASIQMGMLPRRVPLFPNHPQIEVDATLIPAKGVGGDLYDAYALDSEHVVIALGDVSGKGMPAALFMMRTLTLLRAHGHTLEAAEDVMRTLNELLCENNENNMFVTLCIGVLSVKSGRMLVLNGGHMPILLSRKGSPFKEFTEAKGPLVGVFPEAHFRPAELYLSPGDRLVLYTDGITEAENPQQDQFMLTRTLNVLNETGPEAADMKLLIDRVVDAVVAFTDGATQSDDITIMAMRYKGEVL